MFSDRFRMFKIVLPLTILLVFLFYAQIKGPQIYPGFSDAIENPKNFMDKEINFGGKISGVYAKHIFVKNDNKKIKVNLVLKEKNLNYDISGTAIFNNDKSLNPIKYHLSNLRQYKIILSLIPLIAILYLFFKEYQFDFRKMVFLRKIGIKNFKF